MWRVLELSSYPAAINMAIDEAIGDGVSCGSSPPTIRFYKWKPGAVSIGYFQCIMDEIDLEACRESGIDYVRRRTGGGAVYHDPDGEITYSIIARERYFSRDIRKSYADICSCIISGLRRNGIDSEFKPINDVLVNGRKISGSAQTRRNGVLTQHGTILYKLNRAVMFSVLRPSKTKLSDKPVRSHEDSVTCVLEEKDVTEQELYTSLLLGFTEGKIWQFGSLSNTEWSRVVKLSKKYSSYEWNFAR